MTKNLSFVLTIMISLFWASCSKQKAPATNGKAQQAKPQASMRNKTAKKPLQSVASARNAKPEITKKRTNKKTRQKVYKRKRVVRKKISSRINRQAIKRQVQKTNKQERRTPDTYDAVGNSRDTDFGSGLTVMKRLRELRKKRQRD